MVPPSSSDGLPPLSAIDPTIAERLSRLRGLLRDAQVRAGDSSHLGRHLAVVALDGVTELALHLCVRELGLEPARRWPELVRQVRDQLGDRWAADALQGADELHRARNLVQHAGVLPSADQLAPWAAEVERFVRGLVSASFGLDLSHVSSALGIVNDKLRVLAQRAEDELFEGNADASFHASWDAFQAARSEWARQGGASAGPFGGPFGHMPEFDEFRKANALFGEIEERLDISTFAPDVSEWIWLRRQHAESLNASPPTLEDAQRALAFVLGWILRFESYSVRYPDERWRAWREQRKAPKTGIPGGPHLSEPRVAQWTARQASGYEWVFQVSDLPTTDAEFSSALSVASSKRTQDGLIGTAYIALDGILKLRVPDGTSPADVLNIARELLVGAEDVLATWREIQDRAESEKTTVAERFRQAFDTADLPISDIAVYLQDDLRGGSAPKSVGVKLKLDQLISERAVEGIGWDLHNALNAALNDFSFGRNPAEGVRGHADSVQFPAHWEPETVIRWIRHALKIAEQRYAERVAQLDADEQALHDAVTEMETLLHRPAPAED